MGRVMYVLLLISGAALLLCSVGGTQVAKPEKRCNDNVPIRGMKALKEMAEANFTVIEGSLVISVLTDVTDEVNDIHFHGLVEITHMLLMYEVHLLRSLGSLFPDLRVIRGMYSIQFFSVIIMNLRQLEDASLPNLHTVERHGVRMVANPQLCFTRTVDWSLLTRSFPHDGGNDLSGNDLSGNDLSGNDLSGNDLSNNAAEEECRQVELCPFNLTRLHEREELGSYAWTEDRRMAVANIEENMEKDEQQRCSHCWNPSLCQDVTPFERRRFLVPGTNQTCHKQCLGDCKGPTASDCYVCRKLKHNGECMETCPGDLVSYDGLRCVTRDDCFKSSARYKNKTFRVFEGACVDKCPDGYEETPESCQRCIEGQHCERECPGGLFMMVDELRRLKGCTTVTYLVINVRDGEPKDFEEHLSSIRVVKRYLKIFRTNGLTSLSCFKNLREIQGDRGDNKVKRPDEKKTVLTIRLNNNLHTLFNASQLDMYGHYFSIHWNERLCDSTIKEFVRATYPTNYTEYTALSDISETNGNKGACGEVHNLEVEIKLLLSGRVDVSWKLGDKVNKNSVYTYLINYIEVQPGQTVDYMEGDEGQCWNTGQQGSNKEGAEPPRWNRKEVPNRQNSATATGFASYTRYALYVSSQQYELFNTLTIRSPIIYFTTEMGTPTLVQDIQVKSRDSSNLLVGWERPAKPEGPISEYHVYVTEIGHKLFNSEQYHEGFCLTLGKIDEEEEEELSGQAGQPALASVTPSSPTPDLDKGFVGTDAHGNPQCFCEVDDFAQSKKDRDSEGLRSYFEAAFMTKVLAIAVKRPQEIECLADKPLKLKTQETRSVSTSKAPSRATPGATLSTTTQLPAENLRKGDPLVDDAVRAYITTTLLGLDQEEAERSTASTTTTTTTTTAPSPSNTSESWTGLLNQTVGFGNETTAMSNDSTTVNESMTTTPMPTVTEQPTNKQRAYVVNGSETTLLITDLKHYTKYAVEIVACNVQRVTNYQKRRCSRKAFMYTFTAPADGLDQMNASRFKVKYLPQDFNSDTNEGQVTLEWVMPAEGTTNGPVTSFEVRAIFLGNEVPSYLWCVSAYDFAEMNETFVVKVPRGRYRFGVRMRVSGNLHADFTEYPENIYVLNPVEAESNTTLVVAVPAVCIIIVGLLATLAIYCYHSRRKVPDNLDFASINPDYWDSSTHYQKDEFEVDRKKIEIVRELGQGSFGMVYEGIGRGLPVLPDQEEVRVAIKTVNGNASIKDRMEFLDEASTMKQFQCVHIVRLLGVVSVGQPNLVIMELMANGDLKNYLRMHRPDEPDNHGRKPPKLQQVLKMAAEIADGMSYLADKKFVHRDLAARNCMVAENMAVKIGDFGMTRDIYETEYFRIDGKGLLPIRWMAPESIKDGKFTSQSDVWSYGIVLWEMATLAAQPYMGYANEEVINYVCSGKTLNRPEGCPVKLCELMDECWKYFGMDRPTFRCILDKLRPDLDDAFLRRSYSFNKNSSGGGMGHSGLPGLPEEEHGEYSPLTGDRMEAVANGIMPPTAAAKRKVLKEARKRAKKEQKERAEAEGDSDSSTCSDCNLLKKIRFGGRRKGTPSTLHHTTDFTKPVPVLPFEGSGSKANGGSKGSASLNGSASGAISYLRRINSMSTSSC